MINWMEIFNKLYALIAREKKTMNTKLAKNYIDLYSLIWYEAIIKARRNSIKHKNKKQQQNLNLNIQKNGNNCNI